MLLYTSNPYYDQIVPELQAVLQWFTKHCNADAEYIDEKVETTMKIVMKRLTDTGQYQENNPRMWVDCLIVGCYLYYMFEDIEHPVSSLFYPRDLYEKNKDAEEFKKFAPTILNAIFETVESAKGPQTAVLKCQPGPGTPADVLAMAIWYVRNF